MLILGISCFYHDAAAALIKNGLVLAAAEEERFTRIKHDFSFPINAINYCLKEVNVNPNELDYIIFYEKPFLKFERVFKTILASFPKSLRLFQESMLYWLKKKLWIKSIIKEELNYKGEILFAEHHLSHAASTFFASPFERATIITVDGVGEWATITIGIGKENKIELKKQIDFPHSLGLLYSAFTAFLGFKVNNGEYKVMGMAPYGQPKYTDKIYNIIKVEKDGSFKLNMEYFSYHWSPNKTFNKKFIELFGKPRDPEDGRELDPYYADIAASIQKVLEDILLRIINNAYKEYGLKKLCLAGGVALNSVANGKILRETPFDEIFIQPQAGDGGCAIGAAFYLYYTILDKERKFIQEHAYYGPKYTNKEIEEFLNKGGIRYKKLDDEDLFEKIVNYLKEGKIIGWFQGRMEWGPRALGNRSILADPRKAEMKDIINSKIKFREPFRPFAPSILAEKAEEWLEIENPQKNYPFKYMLYVANVKKKKRGLVPAITHIDGTTRPQLVYKKDNPFYYRLIEKFYESTNIPLILNTSFNLRGEPIVCSPDDAFKTFSKSGLDVLVLNNFLIEK